MSQSEQSYDFEQNQSLEIRGIQANHEQEESMSIEVDPPISAIQSTFNQLDKDKRGFIRKSALQQTVMLTSQQYDRGILRRQIDQCGDEIKFSRFIQIFQTANVGDSVNQWLFGLYDKDQKGYVDVDDLKRVADITGVELTDDEINEMVMTERNRNNGKVDFQDFKFIMEEQIQFL